MTDGNRGSPLSRVTHGKSKFFQDDRGSLDVLDIVDYAPFTPVRMFWISGVAPGTARGGHAHKACSQFFVCISGKIQVDAFDGVANRTFQMQHGEFLNVVPGIFATETFLEEGSVLLVLCDRPYEQDDYIHDRDLLVPNADD
jgi:dTDP-4-dehydrorhamnose 3,5-epimerase-like enzyme